MPTFKVKKILGTKNIPKKDGTGTFPVHNVLSEDDQVFDYVGVLNEGQTIEGYIEETKYGKKFKAAGTANNPGGRREDPNRQASIERQNALNNAIAYATAKAGLMDKTKATAYLTGKQVIETAFYFLKFTQGSISFDEIKSEKATTAPAPTAPPSQMEQDVQETFDVEEPTEY